MGASSCNTSSKKSVLLRRDQIDAHFHDPYILNGYRPPGDSLWNTLRFCLDTACNESFNTWSHAVAVLYFIVRFHRVFDSHWHDPVYWPLMCYSLGILAVFFMSASAHALNSLSKHARHRCFYLDYAGISVYGLGTGQVMYFYCRKFRVSRSYEEDQWEFHLFVAFLMCSIATSLLVNLSMCATRRTWCKSKTLYRTASCVMPFLVNSTPYFHRLWDSSRGRGTVDDHDTTWLPLYQKHVFYLFLTALSNVLKFPERSYPGLFDAFGQSHHFVHTFIFLACDDMFEFSLKEMERRKNLIDQQLVSPTFYNTLFVTVVSVLVNMCIAAMFDSSPETDTQKKHEKFDKIK